MAEIREYTPQVAAPEPVGGTSPNVELSGAVGRGLEDFGNAISEGSQVIHRANVRKSTADTYAYFADQRAQKTGELQKQIQDGTLNTDDFLDKFDDETGQFQDNVSTSEGQAFFQRQHARLRGQLMQMANKGTALVAANEAKGQWTQGINQSSSALMNDPSQFHDVYEQGLETVDQLIKTGGLPESMRDKAVKEMGREYTKGAIRGWAELDPATAKHMLDQGAYDQFMDTDMKHQMGLEVDRAARSNDIENQRSVKAVQDAQKANSEKWGQDNFEALENNALSTKKVVGAVRDGTLTAEQGEKYMRLIDEGSKRDFKSNPRYKNQVIQKIVSGEISDPEELMAHVGQGKLNVPDFTQLSNFMNKTPEQKAVNQGEKALFDAAKRTIRFKSLETGQDSPVGEQKLAQFMSDYAKAKRDVSAGGGKVSDLLDPDSNLYFGNKFQQYHTSILDGVQSGGQDRINKALNLRPTDAATQPKPADKMARKPNETIQDWRARTKYKGGGF